MEDNAYEALIIAVYVFVFIAATSATIYLFSTVNDYAELAFNYGKTVSQNNVTETKEGSEEYVPSTSEQIILNGSEVVTYYFNYINLNAYGDQKPDLDYVLTIDGVNSSTLTYKQMVDKVDMQATYKLTFEGYDSNGKKKIKIGKA